MGRVWYPKHKCICRTCGWKRIRTEFCIRNPCPKCKRRSVERVEKE